MIVLFSMGIQVIMLLISIVIHEVAHGVAAWRLGDPTAKSEGRLTLNPVVHMDLVGSLLVPGLSIIVGAPVLIGWAKPVPINPRFFRNPSRDMMVVAIAGPLSNLCLVGIAILLFNLGVGDDMGYWLIRFIQLNTVLAVFNLFPIPPLDGSRILSHFLPFQGREILNRIEPYGFFIVLLLAYMGILSTILTKVLVPVWSVIEKLL
jgi:Zn-dependent protease